ncbi:MAG: glycoside hydrolase family 15 protein [Bradymonadaceae bacterium]
MKVVQRDSIPPDRDVLVRHYTVEVTGNQSYETIDLLGYANLAPGLSKVPQIPLLDVLMDHKNDFLAVWNKANDAVIHFHPGDTGVIDQINEAVSAATGTLKRDFGPLGELLKDEQPDTTEIDSLAADLDANYAKGVYAALGASPSPTSFQIGEDDSKFCESLGEIADNIAKLQERRPDSDLPADPAVADLVRCESFHPTETIRERKSWSYTAEDAFSDMQDGQLQENRLAGAQANSVLRVPVDFSNSGDVGEATLYVAMGETSQKAIETLDWAKNQGASAIEQSVIDADEQFVDDLYIPEEVTGDLRKFIKRAFLNLKVGTDADTGAIVASISRQPSYQLDWPRDGAFFNTALDLAGQHDLVTKRMKFYSETIRDEPKEPVPFVNSDGPGWPSQPNNTNYPADSWEMNYYADGVPGGNIRLEIDNTALLVWAYVAHVGHLPEGKRSAYIDREWPTIKRAANFVASWRDPDTGLMWPANEDDHAAFTQGFQGASTSYLALVSAARLAKHRG